MVTCLEHEVSSWLTGTETVATVGFWIEMRFNINTLDTIVGAILGLFLWFCIVAPLYIPAFALISFLADFMPHLEIDRSLIWTVDSRVWLLAFSKEIFPENQAGSIFLLFTQLNICTALVWLNCNYNCKIWRKVREIGFISLSNLPQKSYLLSLRTLKAMFQFTTGAFTHRFH